MSFLRILLLAALCCCRLAVSADDGKLLVTDSTGTMDNTALTELSYRVYFVNQNDVSMRWCIFPELPAWIENKAGYLAENGLPANAIVFMVGLHDGRMQVLFGDAFNSARRRQVIPWVEKVVAEKFMPAAAGGELAKAVSDSVSAFEVSAHGIKNNYDNLTWLLACGVLAVGALLFWEHRERRKANIYLAGLMVAALIGMGAYAAVKFLTFTSPGELRFTWTSVPAVISGSESVPAPGASNTVQ